MSRHERALVGRGLREGGYVSSAVRRRRREVMADQATRELKEWEGIVKVAGIEVTPVIGEGDIATVRDVRDRIAEQDERYKRYLANHGEPPQGWERYAQWRSLLTPPRS